MKSIEGHPAAGAVTRPIGRGDFLRRGALAGVTVSGLGAVTATTAGAHGPRDRGHHRSSGLHDRVNRVSHVVCNVSDLERAREFWERWTPLRAYARTTSPRQSFRSLGIRSGRFDGYLLRDLNDEGTIIPRFNSFLPGFSMSVHLVEWKDPKPVGVPYQDVTNLGWNRLAFGTSRPIGQVYDDFVAGGVTPFAPPADDFQVIGVPDPDGILLEYFERAGVTGSPGLADRVSHFAGSTHDATRSLRFYRDVAGLDYTARISSCPVTNTMDRNGGKAGFDAVYFMPRGDRHFTPERLSWTGDVPGPATGRPYTRANHLGYQRLSLEVDDIDAAYRTLLGAARRFRGVRVAGPPEEWDFGPEIGTRRVVVFTDHEGVGHELISQPPYGEASVSPVPTVPPVCPAD